MAKPQSSKTAIVKQGSNSSLVCSDLQEKAAIITGYIEKFAAIDGRKEATETLYGIYVEAICRRKPEFSVKQIEKGLREYLELGKGWPWPGTLIEMIEEQV